VRIGDLLLVRDAGDSDLEYLSVKMTWYLSVKRTTVGYYNGLWLSSHMLNFN
jgi:hypothetical protein